MAECWKYLSGNIFAIGSVLGDRYQWPSLKTVEQILAKKISNLDKNPTKNPNGMIEAIIDEINKNRWSLLLAFIIIITIHIIPLNAANKYIILYRFFTSKKCFVAFSDNVKLGKAN